MSHDAGKVCKCVKRHSPSPVELHRHHVWPLSLGGPEKGNEVWLCPTSHTDVHELIRNWQKYQGEPPWSVRRHYGKYIRGLAEKAYWKWFLHVSD